MNAMETRISGGLATATKVFPACSTTTASSNIALADGEDAYIAAGVTLASTDCRRLLAFDDDAIHVEGHLYGDMIGAQFNGAVACLRPGRILLGR